MKISQNELKRLIREAMLAEDDPPTYKSQAAKKADEKLKTIQPVLDSIKTLGGYVEFLTAVVNHRGPGIDRAKFIKAMKTVLDQEVAEMKQQQTQKEKAVNAFKP